MRKNLSLLTVLLLFSVIAWSQTKTVTGRVTDESGGPVPFATITVKGTSTGVAADQSGNFSITVPAKAILSISAVGFEEQEVAVGNQTNITVSLKAASALQEVVVTALGIRKEKKRLGYSITEVSGDDIEKSKETNVIEALAAKVPGAQITSSGGTPGASSKILLRGNSTFTGNNSPLMVVDGIPVDNSTSQPIGADYPFNVNLSGVNESNRGIDINPADIESISVLKGPAAASLYGARGGNGAIIITTKKGRYGTGRKLGITASSSVELSKVNKLPEYQKEYVQGNGGVYSSGTPNSWGPKKENAGLPIYDDKYGQFFQTGTNYTNNIAIDGGSETSIFRLGIGNSQNKGIIPNSKFNRTNISFSGETKLKNWLTVGASANYVNSDGRRVQNGSTTGGVMLTLLRTPINYNVDDYIDPLTGRQTQYYSVYDNPKFTAYRNPYTDNTNRLYGNVYTTISVLKDLSIDWRVGVDYYNTDSKQIYDLSSTGNDAADGTGQLNLSNNANRQISSNLNVKYKTFITKNLEVNILGGYNLWDNQSKFYFQRGSQFLVPNLYNLGNTANLYGSNTEIYEQTNGLYGEIGFNYNAFLNLTVAGRNDWTTAFGRGGTSVFYPKVDLAWIFSEHIPANDILSYGKLRMAYSDAGTGPDPYTYSKLTYFIKPFITDGATNGNSFPYLGQGGFAPSNVQYPGGLIPAHVTGKEIGLELRLLKNRVFIEATYYNQISKDNILTKPVAPSTGYQYEIANSGEVENKGYELAWGFDVVKGKNVQWSIGGNWSKNMSKVLSLADGVTEIPVESGFSEIGAYAIVGQPYGVFYGSAWERNAEGKILVLDDGRAVKKEVQVGIGNPNPDWLMGISSNLNFRGVALSVLFDIRRGGKIWNGTWARLQRIGVTDESVNREQEYVIDGVYADGTAKPGEKNTSPVSAVYYFQTFKGDGGNYAAENAIQDGSWFRLRTVSLGYRFNFTKASSVINYLDIAFTGRNLWLNTKYTGVDPETSLTGGGSNLGGWDYFNNPGVKNYGVTLKVGL
ncbi:SusC/RagA family TonB-linked outer membrane protein [Agriterribacter sp.]|uniref:SusC/RagA family TonB-linked outer membrane protein n=1 Tax=Agriterribacter sp. TaxID=2821509 RepID=UPI002BC79F05|nr:SusC/RagA family TonB-linked outer membrane protein [Agriterribacter sp.]HTN07804.1 SusC/RagA family TonB-linked outer membrane protein [Agriterribacter sp.]